MENLLDKLSDSNIVKMEHKAIKVVVGFILGYFLVNMASKFVDDNFSFRIKKISNLPDNTVSPPQN